MIAPEFSRRIRLDEISATPRRHAVAAEAAERALLAERFGLADLRRLEADIALSREAAGIRARGQVRASVDQVCVISGEPVAAEVDEAVEVLFTFEDARSDDEVELGTEDCDTLPLETDWVDLGELAAETMCLALEPYPKLPDPALAQYRRLLLSEEEAAAAAAEAAQQARNPFSVLKKP